MKKLTELFDRKDFEGCKALKTELGYTTKRFWLDTPQEAIEWLEECKSNSIEFILDTWSDNPKKVVLRSIDDEIEIEPLE